MTITATRMMYDQSSREEQQPAARNFIQHTQTRLTNALGADKIAMLNARADQLTDALKADASRHEWMEAKTLMRFGGRPPRCGTEHPCLEDENGNPLPDHEQEAEAELTYFAKAEHSIFRTPEEICDTYKQHSLQASTIRALQDTPLDNQMTKYESQSLFQQSKTGRSGGPDGITDDLTRRAPKEMMRIQYPITAKA